MSTPVQASDQDLRALAAIVTRTALTCRLGKGYCRRPWWPT
jgi:hypothetical protein